MRPAPRAFSFQPLHAGAFARKIKAAIEAQNATQTVVLLAEARIGQELKAAQDRGELAKADGSTHHRPKEGARSAGTLPATLDSLGIPSQRASEMRKLAELGPAVIREAAQAANDAGMAVTLAVSAYSAPESQ